MVVNAIVGLVLVPIILSHLGVKGYGIWALLARGLAYPVILERAFGLAISRFVAFYREDSKELNRFVSASFVILLGLSFITVLVTVLLSFYIADIFTAIPVELAFDAQIVCILVGITLVLDMLASCFGGALQGLQYYSRSNGVLVICIVFRTILIILILVIWKSVIAVQLGYVIASALSMILMFIVAQKSIPNFRINITLVNRKAIRDLWYYTSHSLARSGSRIIMFNTLTLLVGWKGTAKDVTIYDVALKLPDAIRSLLGGMQNVFLPVVTSFCAKGKFYEINTVVKKATQICFSLTCISSILLFALADEIMVFWLGYSTSKEMILVMRLLIISVVPDGIFGIWLPTLVGVGYLRGLTIAAIAGASGAILIAFVLLDFVTVPMAPTIAMIAVMSVYRGLWLPSYGIYKLGIHSYDYLRASLRQPFIAAIVSIFMLWGLNTILPKWNVLGLYKFIIYTFVVICCFATICLREEIANFVVVVRKRLEEKKGVSI